MHHHLAVPPCPLLYPLCLHKRGYRRGQGDRARARHRHGAKRNGGVHCGSEKAEYFPVPPCACTKGDTGGDRAIGREPATDMEQSGMEVCTARVRKRNISLYPLVIAQKGVQEGTGR